jgi:hypothetical protein
MDLRDTTLKNCLPGLEAEKKSISSTFYDGIFSTKVLGPAFL